EPLGQDDDGTDVFLRDVWPTREEIDATIAGSVEGSMFTSTYADVYTGDERWASLETPSGDLYAWADDSTYVRLPPYFDGMTREAPGVGDVAGARCLVMLGDSVTTDHISPAGAIRPDSPAGTYLVEHGVERRDFNSYGARLDSVLDEVRAGRSRAARLQLVRRAPRQPRSDGAWHVRERPSAQ